MAFHSDPQFDERMDQYFSRDCNPEFLYQGSNENIIERLKAWVVRQKELYKEQFELRDKCQKSSWELLNKEPITREPGYLRGVSDRSARVEIIDNQANINSKRAMYLLDTLRSRDITWPDLWYRPEIDGGVCSFLGTVDEKFDTRATLIELEAKEEEERLQAGRAEIEKEMGKANRSKMPRVRGQQTDSSGERSSNGPLPKMKFARVSSRPDLTFLCVGEKGEQALRLAMAMALDPNLSSTGHGGPSENKQSRQEKRAEARKEAKAKDKDEK